MEELWDEKTIADYFYVMQSAFYDSSAAADAELIEDESLENTEEAEEL